MPTSYQANPSPLVIALVTQKGGSGKTTLAANLAVAAAEAGQSVVMYDIDPQASLCAWAKDRPHENIDVAERTNFSPSDINTLPDMLLNDQPITLVILDCPGINSTQTNAAMKIADFCLVPSRPTIMDIRASRPTVQALIGLKRPFAFVLNQCTPGRTTGRTMDGRNALELMGGLAEPMIGLRSDYQDAMREGLGVTEYAPDSKAAEEMRQLWSWTAAHAVRPPKDQDQEPDAPQKKIDGGHAVSGTATYGGRYAPVTKIGKQSKPG